MFPHQLYAVLFGTCSQLSHQLPSVHSLGTLRERTGPPDACFQGPTWARPLGAACPCPLLPILQKRKQRHGDDLTQVTQLGSGNQMGIHSVWLQSPSSSCVFYCIPNLPNLFEILLSFCFCQKTSSFASFLDPKNNPMSPSNYSSCNPLPRCWGNRPWLLANICT